MAPPFRELALPVIAVASLAIFSVVGASASTLGGLRTTDLGASEAAIAIHTSGITVQWKAVLSGTTWVLNGIVLKTSGADSFAAGERLRLTIVDTASAVVCEITMTNALQSSTITIARSTINTACGTTGISYSRVDRVALVAAS